MTVYNFAAQVTVSPHPSPDDVDGPAVPLLEATAQPAGRARRTPAGAGKKSRRKETSP